MKNRLGLWLPVLAVIITFFLSSCEDDIIPEINPLHAHAGADRQVSPGTTVELDGTGSSDDQGKEFSYSWEIINKPSGSSVNLDKETSSRPVFSPDKPGDYVITLSIHRDGWTAKDEVKIKAMDPSGPVVISDDILEDRVLKDVFPDDWAKADYLVSRSIRLEAKLSIRPGVKIAFAEEALFTITTTGTLVAEGGPAPAEHIYLAGLEEKPGYWKGILFFSASELNKMQHVQLSAAGSETYAGNIQAGMLLEGGSKMRVLNSRFTNNKGYGLYIQPGAQLLAFDGNKLDQNTKAPIALSALQVENLEINCLFMDGGIEVTDYVLNSGGLVNWHAFDAPYQLMQGLEITSSTGLILEEGTRLQFHADQRLAALMGSFVEAVGTEARPVILEGVEARSGYWKGIVVANTGQIESAFSHAVIQHTGSSPLAGSQAVSIQLLTDGRISLDHTVIRFGAGDGIEATSDGSGIFHFAENTISDHAGHPIVVSTENVAVLDYHTRFVNIGKPEVRVDGNNPIARDEETVWKGFQQEIPYRIKGLSNDLMVWSGFKLTEGVVLQFEDRAAMHVQDANGRMGYLKIAGTENKNVIIKGVSETAGSWYGITISSLSPDNHISFAQILHGGKRRENNFSAVITVDIAPEGRLSIQNSVVGYSGQHGISVVNTSRANLMEAQVNFTDIPESPVYAW